MPLVVKLKNPKHGKAAADEEPVFGQGAGEASGQVTVQEPGQSQGYEEVGVRVKQEDHIDDGDAAEGLLNGQTSFSNLRLEQARSPSDDSGLDDLASAFAQSSIQDAGPGVGHPAPPTLPPPLVDVLVAPAVLGHRYVRGRDTSFIVERPERIRGVLLGLSTVLARLESEAEGGGPAQDDAYMDLSDRLGRLNVVEAGSARGQTTLLKPFSVLLSSRSLDLSNTSNGALGYIHAHPDEMLGAEAQGEPSQYAAREAAKASYDVSTNRQILPTSYANFLVRLCAQAPFSAPPPRPPRKLRSPKVRESADSSSDEDEGSARLSEVPIHMPQGDLYLCGPRPKPAVVKEEEEKEASTYFDKQAPSTPQHQQQLAEPKTPEGTANRTVPFPQNPDPQTPQPRPAAAVPQKGLDNEPQGSHWTAQGTRGAIEAALGACCTAVDRVVAAATLRDPSEDAAVERIDVDDLLKSLRPVPLNHNVEPTPAPASAALPARPPSKRAFVLTRPPGHHCSATQPSGFCWVNNVAVLAAHAYEAHGIDRIAVLDIDLHHGNGTQSLAWRINADSVRKDAEREAKLAANKSKIRGPRRSAGVSVAEQEMDAGRRGLKMFYGSLHDIESFPCEDGDEGLVKDASTCIMGAHGQWIWNIHLDSHSSPSEFAELYANKYRALLSRADEFFARTESTPSKSLVVLSTGFDACQHELPGMQRHGKYVPVSFYETFTRDVVWRLAETRTGGKVVSVLEGGYSERALVSATIGHLVGLSSSSRAGEEGSKEEQGPPLATREEWYGLPALLALEKAVSKQLGGAHGLAGSSSSASAHATPLAKRKGFPESTAGDWLGATMEAFWRMWEACGHERRTASQSNKERKAGLLKPTVPVSPWTPRELRSARGTNASG